MKTRPSLLTHEPPPQFGLPSAATRFEIFFLTLSVIRPGARFAQDREQ